jgi:hypothetical protein
MKDVQTLDLLVKLNHSEVVFIPSIYQYASLCIAGYILS